MAIKREELLCKREEVLERIKNLEAEVKSTRFISNRYYEGYGMVENMDKDTLVAAFADLKSRMTSGSNALSELGFGKDELEDETYLGFTFAEWSQDFQTRAKQIRNEEKIEKLYTAVDIMEDNLSEEDRFSLDMKAVEELL